jgi:hypothetical protein
MFLVIGGLILISILMINFFSVSGVQYNTKAGNEAIITAVGIGQSLIELMARKAFDEKTINSAVSDPDMLTQPGLLGPEYGETDRSLFDDIDDYNHDSSFAMMEGLGKFFYKIQVYYVPVSNPDQKSNNRTFAKRADIKIINSFMRDTLNMKYVYTY